MTPLSQTACLLAAALAAFAAAQALAVDARASKEKFVRSKPHVNVGTAGRSGRGRIAPGPNAYVPQPLLTPRPGPGVGVPMSMPTPRPPAMPRR